MEEALAPQAHHITADRECGSDLVIGLSASGQEYDSGAQYLKIRQRIFARTAFQDLALLA
jgi:hypothetical protein